MGSLEVLSWAQCSSTSSSMTWMRGLKEHSSDLLTTPSRGGIANPLEDQLNLQKDLGRLEPWGRPKKMQLSGRKSKVLHLGGRNQRRRYRVRGTWLNRSTCEGDLGVLV